MDKIVLQEYYAYWRGNYSAYGPSTHLKAVYKIDNGYVIDSERFDRPFYVQGFVTTGDLEAVKTFATEQREDPRHGSRVQALLERLEGRLEERGEETE